MDHLRHINQHVVSAMLEDHIIADYLLHYQLEKEKNGKRKRFNIHEISEDVSWSKFRFTKEDVGRLQHAFRIPETIRFSNRIKETGLNSLLVVLRRLSYPNRWVDLQDMFSRPKSELSIIFKETVDYLYDTFRYLFEDVSLLYWLRPEYLKIYSTAVSQKGSPLRRCWGFIDGTARPMCRPSFAQVVAFSGHKRCHCLKFQSVMVPNGLICHMYGPIEGRRHDAILLRFSGLLNQIQGGNFIDGEGNPYVLYGDPAYPTREHLIAPFKGANLTPLEEAFNFNMKKVRQCVEWGFGDITTNWAFIDFKKNLKVLLQPIAKYYIVASILSNCKCCLYGNQTSKYFGLDPPTIENYLSNTL